MSLSYQEIKESKVKTKFYSELENKIMTRSEIIKIVTWDWDRISDEDNFNELVLLNHKSGYDSIPCDLVELKKVQIMRENRVHDFDCEFATGRSCHCWCNEKYHGMKGQKL